MELTMGLSGVDLEAILDAVLASGAFGSGIPVETWVDGRQEKPTANWRQRVATCKRDVSADFGVPKPWVRFDRGTIVKAACDAERLAPAAILELLTSLPFALASFDGVFSEWYTPDEHKYRAPGFSNMHWSHGWACAFKGRGHERLVSRRWLEYGPWRVLRGANDTTLVQFHDLEADAATALAQAKPGHERMGISETGGFLQLPNYPFTHDLGGVYDASKRQLSIVVHGRDVSQREMRDACAARALGVLGPDKPLATVAYVFMEEERARAHLHEMWLREIEVRAFVRGVETRIDDTYQPPVEKPEWVRRLDDHL
jgi:hypothetical protein